MAAELLASQIPLDERQRAIDAANALFQGLRSLPETATLADLTMLQQQYCAFATAQASALCGHALPDLKTFRDRGRRCFPDGRAGPATASSARPWIDERAVARIEALNSKYNNKQTRDRFVSELLRADNYVSDEAWTTFGRDVGFVTSVVDDLRASKPFLPTAPSDESTTNPKAFFRSSSRHQTTSTPVLANTEVRALLDWDGQNFLGRAWARMQETAMHGTKPVPPSHLDAAGKEALRECLIDAAGEVGQMAWQLQKCRGSGVFTMGAPTDQATI